MALKKESKVKSNFNRISIGLASPEDILNQSYGEVLKPDEFPGHDPPPFLSRIRTKKNG